MQSEEGVEFEEQGKVAVCPRNGKPGLCLSLDWSKDRSRILTLSRYVCVMSFPLQSGGC